jgi:hypothetical protein
MMGGGFLGIFRYPFVIHAMFCSAQMFIKIFFVTTMIVALFAMKFFWGFLGIFCYPVVIHKWITRLSPKSFFSLKQKNSALHKRIFWGSNFLYMYPAKTA